jgi:hypothetical protein
MRARTPAGIAQEVYALLACYQILRIAITDAIEAEGGIDPDRASFTVALNAARDLLIQAAGVIAGTVIDLTGRYRPAGPGQPAPRPAAARQPAHRQTRALPVPGQKDQISPDAATKSPLVSASSPHQTLDTPSPTLRACR